MLTDTERQEKTAKVCEWLGIEANYIEPGSYRIVGGQATYKANYHYDDALAMRVLRELAKRGYDPCSAWATDQWLMELWDRDGRRFKGTADDPADAILLATDALREKEVK